MCAGEFDKVSPANELSPCAEQTLGIATLRSDPTRQILAPFHRSDAAVPAVPGQTPADRARLLHPHNYRLRGLRITFDGGIQLRYTETYFLFNTGELHMSSSFAPPPEKPAGGVSAKHPASNLFPIFVAPSFAGKGKNTIRMELIPVACWKLNDVRFAFNSSFVLPETRNEFIELMQLRVEHAGAPFSVFGHADPVGDDGYNKKVSGHRADSIYAVLTRDTARWEKLYLAGGTDEGWGIASIQRMLVALGFEPGPLTGTKNTKTTQAIQKFQNDSGLTVDGIAGPKTRVKLFAAYMDFLCPQTVAKTEFLARGTDPKGKGDVQGCSEFNPVMVLSKDEQKELSLSENREARDAANSGNRRVMVLLFRPGTVVPADKWPCPRTEEGTGGCRKRFWSDGDFRRSPQLLEREFGKSQDTFACRFYHRLVVASPCEGVLPNELLESRFALTQFEGVAKLFTDKEFHSWMLMLFGADIPMAVLEACRKQLVAGTFPNCPIKLVSGGIDGHSAAYDRIDKIIIIDKGLARAAEVENDPAMELAASLVEEFGHFIDDQLRTVLSSIGGDAQLDEGALFGHSIVNIKHDIEKEAVVARYTHDAAVHVITMRYDDLLEATKEFFSEQEIIDDARTERFEFFGAGAGVRRKGHQPDSSLGHESIEFVLESVGFLKTSDPSTSELKRVYYGNWLRDYSQAIDPKLVRPPLSSSANDGFLRDSLTQIIDLLAREHFEDDPIFKTTMSRLGLYRPEEHIDNPDGIKDSTGIDPQFRKAVDPKELEIDLGLGLKKYIRTPGLPRDNGPSTAAEFIVSELDAAIGSGRSNEGFRHLGAALHTIEDYFAHSNFVELSLIELGRTNVFPWAGTTIGGATNPVLNGKFPIVTGSFGASDTAVSVLDVLGEHLQNEKPCTPGERGFGAKAALILLNDKGESKLTKRLEFVLKKIETLQLQFPRIAKMMCKVGEKLLGWLRALIGLNIVHIMEGVEIAQQAFVDDPKSYLLR